MTGQTEAQPARTWRRDGLKKKMWIFLKGLAGERCRLILVIVVYCMALLSFVSLPMFAKNGRLDEKSLLLGLTRPTTTDALGQETVKIADMLEKRARSDCTSGGMDRKSLNLAMMVEEAEIEWRKHYMIDNEAVGSQSWMSTVFDNGCSTVHKTIESRRGDGTESLLLVVPVKKNICLLDERERQNQGLPTSSFAIAVGVQVSKMLARVPWLAKDIVILMIEEASCQPSIAIETWFKHFGDLSVPLPHISPLEFGQGTNSEFENNSTSHLRLSSTIQQALVLEFESPMPTEARLGVLGYNGQLPNLDLVILTKKNLDYFTAGLSIGLDVGGFTEHWKKQNETWRTLLQRLEIIVRMTYAHARGLSKGLHGPLLKKNIDAISIVFTSPNNSNFKNSAPDMSLPKPKTARNALSAVEMVFRSLNNLEERLHHATGLYLPAGPGSVVPAGFLLLPPGLMLISSILLSMYLIVSLKNQTGLTSGHFKIGLIMALIFNSILIQAFYYHRMTGIESVEKNNRIHYLGYMVSVAMSVVVPIIMSSVSWIDMLHPRSGNIPRISESMNEVKINKESGFHIFQSFLVCFMVLASIEATIMLLVQWSISFLAQSVIIPSVVIILKIFHRLTVTQ